MATKEEVKKLAALTRITVSDAELETFISEFDAILAYIGQLENLKLSDGKESKPVLRNVMRADEDPHVSGKFTEKLAEQFPAREGDALVVKQIISRD